MSIEEKMQKQFMLHNGPINGPINKIPTIDRYGNCVGFAPVWTGTCSNGKSILTDFLNKVFLDEISTNPKKTVSSTKDVD